MPTDAIHLAAVSPADTELCTRAVGFSKTHLHLTIYHLFCLNFIARKKTLMQVLSTSTTMKFVEFYRNSDAYLKN